ncbi:alcohol oxidase [Collybia nuda]|uniref:Alcohol oxidase n=1 Tax=Collybia nuda TaxID=64659 RepID=A0A9P5Y2J3_9AGAR|nr:alcohol oxidase [Collybia nuda]
MPIVTAAQFISTKFDYIIVGGGTSGLTLAARLSEDPKVNVGVVEAGGDVFHTPQIDIPGMMGSLIADPTYDWCFPSVPQTHSHNRVVLQPRGKGLGGSTLINLMAMLRPCKDEFDVLEEIGNKGWNWESLLACMKKSETAIPSNLSPEVSQEFAVPSDYVPHGTQGPIIKSFPFRWSKLHSLVVDTAVALGLPRTFKTGSGSTVGVSSSFKSVNPKTATRCSSASSYYEPNASRPNLLVLTHAHVTKVILQAENDGSQRAVGVEFSIGGTRSSVIGVKKEVVLSAGTFQTPQILELSGIGNPDLLAKHGIASVINLPGVGENLQDHISIQSIAEVDSSHETLEVLADPEQLKLHTELYKTQEGLFTTSAAVGFLFASAEQIGSKDKVSQWQAQADVHSAKAMAAISDPTLKEGLKKQYDIQKRWFSDVEQPQAEIILATAQWPNPDLIPTPGKRYVTMFTALLHPLSRGSVHISSSDPIAHPAIDPNYFGHEADLDLFVESLELTLKIYETPPFAETYRGLVIPRPEALEGLSKEERRNYLKSYIKDRCSPIWHPVGTASMLPREQGGVVDSKLKVYGTTNLRVVDLSILPLELSTHLQTTAYAVGEKAAEIFKTLV